MKNGAVCGILVVRHMKYFAALFFLLDQFSYHSTLGHNINLLNGVKDQDFSIYQSFSSSLKHPSWLIWSVEVSTQSMHKLAYNQKIMDMVVIIYSSGSCIFLQHV